MEELRNATCVIIFGGDFNCGNIEHYAGTRGVINRRVQGQLLEIVLDHCLSQVVNIHTRNIRRSSYNKFSFPGQSSYRDAPD